PWNTYDTASHGFALAVMASELAALTGNAGYRQLASRWLGNVLGANAWGVSLAIGDGTTFPHCPQHQVANIAGSLNGTGALLAGPQVRLRASGIWAAICSINCAIVSGSSPVSRR